jgi:hypothetical protein
MEETRPFYPQGKIPGTTGYDQNVITAPKASLGNETEMHA